METFVTCFDLPVLGRLHLCNKENLVAIRSGSHVVGLDLMLGGGGDSPTMISGQR